MGVGRVEVYDTTLRDGAQATGVSFSLNDKLKIAKRLDGLVDYIEGGWPSSNPKDLEFFKEVRSLRLRAKVSAFGSTMKVGTAPEEDSNLSSLLEFTDVVAIFGKSWGLHVKHVLKTTLSENLRLIRESVNYLKREGATVIYDAEHFFDGYADDKAYAMKTLEAAEKSSDVIVLCDTNGGRLPSEISKAVREVAKRIRKPIGIHAHNDSGCAVANTLMAVEAGARHVQVTVNGLGERAGNADLTAVLPALKFKMGAKFPNLKRLTEISNFVSEIANLRNDPYKPYVGRYAFSHKGGVHVDAMLKNKRSYEHLDPALVGNRRAVFVSEQSGKASIVSKAGEFGFKLQKGDPRVGELLKEIKECERRGYQFENADASLYLLMLEKLGKRRDPFDIAAWTSIVHSDGDKVTADGTVMLRVGDKVIHTASQGNGPVNALDLALRKALKEIYPQAERVRLTGYRVKEIDAEEGTAAQVRVFIDLADGGESWTTVGVSTNILEASKKALLDGYRYFLLREGGKA
ncbi:MAG: citramalate synthase [Candidatus Brockarchaeota archaeon]|nr:citramalate synthase [Candidatus Brockarchaeota archaeon]